MLILRAPEITASTLYYCIDFGHIKIISTNDKLITALGYFDLTKLNEITDFLFSINTVFQFLMFYRFNKNFRIGFQNSFLKSKMRKDF